jgi:predicted MFS family arabinose efflux permease
MRPVLVIGLLTRILTDTATQMFFPFLPIFAAGLGITAVAMGRLVSLRSLMGLFAPLSAPIVNARGYRFVLRLGLLAAGLGYLLIGVSNSVWLVVPGIMLAGLGSYVFVPTLQAYLSANLPYERRARGLGFVELGWALSGIVGLFLLGELIARTSWRAPFFVVGGGLVVAGLLYSLMPAAHGREVAQPPAERPAFGQRVHTYTQLGDNSWSAWAAIFTNFLVIFAALHTFISYGSWMVDAFGLGPAGLGRVALLLGVADLAGASLVTLAGDRIGHRRGFLISSAIGVAAFLLLPVVGGLALAPALLGLLLARFAFEFSIVGLLPLLSEQSPLQRNKVLALGATSGLLGSTVAGFTGPWAYARFGLAGLALPSAVLLSLAGLLVWQFVRDR